MGATQEPVSAASPKTKPWPSARGIQNYRVSVVRGPVATPVSCPLLHLGLRIHRHACGDLIKQTQPTVEAAGSPRPGQRDASEKSPALMRSDGTSCTARPRSVKTQPQNRNSPLLTHRSSVHIWGTTAWGRSIRAGGGREQPLEVINQPSPAIRHPTFS